LFLLQGKVEANRKVLRQHTCALFDVAVTAEVESRVSEGGSLLSQRAVYAQEDNLVSATLGPSSSGCAAQRTAMQFVKLPLVDRIPPYTTWIFVDKYCVVPLF
jgi:[histone H3]-lysine27 N-trimethyltransferase EZH2